MAEQPLQENNIPQHNSTDCTNVHRIRPSVQDSLVLLEPRTIGLHSVEVSTNAEQNVLYLVRPKLYGAACLGLTGGIKVYDGNNGGYPSAGYPTPEYPDNATEADKDVMRVPLISIAVQGSNLYVTDAVGGRILRLSSRRSAPYRHRSP